MIETIINRLREFSWIIAVIVGLPLGYKLSKWLRSKFIFFGTPKGLISAFITCIMIPIIIIGGVLTNVLDSVEYKLTEITKPKYEKYIDMAKEAETIEEKMNYLKKSLKKEYNEEALMYCRSILVMEVHLGNDYEKYFDIIKSELKKEHIDIMYREIYEARASYELNEENYDLAKEYLKKAESLGLNMENSHVYWTIKEIEENKLKQENEEYQKELVSSESIESQKDVYIQKLELIESEVSTLSYDGSTLEMKETSSIVLKKWDDALNEIYGVLKSQLSSSEMESLKEEQIQWIATRDANAEESASEFEGGTMYDLEYTEVLGQLTKERCYELVEIYMK